MKRKAKKTDAARWCDMLCKYADFARESALDGSGSCMTFQALWCRKLKKHVNKNSRCPVRQ